MKFVLLILICIECIVLALLAIKKKITKKVFVLIAGITVVFSCVSMLFINCEKAGADGKHADAKEYIYMAARLTEYDYVDKALMALGQVIDEECQEYGIKELKGLDYNLQGSYLLAVSYLNGESGENEQAIYVSSKRNNRVTDEVIEAVVADIVDKLGFSDEEAKMLDAKMQLKYAVDVGADEVEIQKDAWISAAECIDDTKYDEAYQIMLEEAEKGDVKDGIIVSYMYACNYSNINLSEDDVEYDRLLDDITKEQVKLNRPYVGQKKEPIEEKVEEEVEKNVPLKQNIGELTRNNEYDYRFSLNLLSEEKAKRAINYLKQFEPEDMNVGYDLELARLYFMCNDREMTDQYLNELFLSGKVTDLMWLGSEINMLNNLYLEEMSGSKTGSFDLLFGNIMGALYQGIFDVNDYGAFRNYIKMYLEEAYKGIYINHVDTDAYPKVVIQISPAEGIELTDKSIFELEDTEQMIENFEFEQKEVDALSICFVLDRSGSMSGKSLVDAKDAICRSVLSLDEGTQVGLVSFESDSRIDCNMTYSKYAVSSALSGIKDSGGTNIAAGLTDGMEVLKNGAGDKIIILLSDGHDGESQKIDSVLGQLTAQGIKVYAIGLNGCDEAYLTKIANTTGGQFIMVNNTGKLDAIYSEISNNLTNVYYITYTVDEENDSEGADWGTESSVRADRYVRLKLKNATTQARKRYSLEKEQSVSYDTAYEAEKTEQMADYYRQTGSTQGGDRNE